MKILLLDQHNRRSGRFRELIASMDKILGPADVIRAKDSVHAESFLTDDPDVDGIDAVFVQSDMEYAWSFAESVRHNRPTVMLTDGESCQVVSEYAGELGMGAAVEDCPESVLTELSCAKGRLSRLKRHHALLDMAPV